MREYNCNQLKNIQVPEVWIENALNTPEKRKKFVVPIRFYHFAAGAAACLVLTAAVTFSLLLGINKNAKLTNPNRHSSSVVEQTTADSYAADITVGSSPKGDLPLVFGGDNESSTIVTEPAETDAEGNTVPAESNKQSTKPISGKTKNNSSGSSNSPSSKAENDEPRESEASGETGHTSHEEPSSVIPFPEETITEQPTTEEPWTEPDSANPNHHVATEDPYAEKQYKYSAVVFNGRAKGDVYFKLTDQNGTVIANGLVTDKTPENGKTRISHSVFMRRKAGDTYTAVFYGSDGKVIHQQSYYIWY